MLHILSVVFRKTFRCFPDSHSVSNVQLHNSLLYIFRGMMWLPVNVLCFGSDHSDGEKYRVSEFQCLSLEYSTAQAAPCVYEYSVCVHSRHSSAYFLLHFQSTAQHQKDKLYNSSYFVSVSVSPVHIHTTSQY